MAHNHAALVAQSRRPNPTSFQKSIVVDDYYFGFEDWEYPLGHIQMLGKTNADMLMEGAPRFVPGRALEQVAAHVLHFG